MRSWRSLQHSCCVALRVATHACAIGQICLCGQRQLKQSMLPLSHDLHSIRQHLQAHVLS